MLPVGEQNSNNVSCPPTLLRPLLRERPGQACQFEKFPSTEPQGLTSPRAVYAPAGRKMQRASKPQPLWYTQKCARLSGLASTGKDRVTRTTMEPRESTSVPSGSRCTVSAGKQSRSWQQRLGYQECAAAVASWSRSAPMQTVEATARARRRRTSKRAAGLAGVRRGIDRLRPMPAAAHTSLSSAARWTWSEPSRRHRTRTPTMMAAPTPPHAASANRLHQRNQ